MRIGILTSTETRHLYFANRLREVLDVVAIGYEDTGYAPSAIQDVKLSREDARTVVAHFAERTRQEELFFSRLAFVPDEDDGATHRIEVGQLNSPETVDFLNGARAELVVIYGTNLVKNPLLERWKGRMINMHLGLSPYYRGTATNFYPLVHGEPEYVGATIHLIDEGIDSGPIFQQVRPDIVKGDMPHTIGCKAIRAGTEAMIDVVNSLEAGTIRAIPQWWTEKAQLSLRKDYKPRHVVELYRRVNAGMIDDYVKRADEAVKKARIVEQIPQTTMSL